MNYKASEISNNFLISFYLNGKNEHVINNASLNKNEVRISDILKRNSTYIIETEINHWVTVTLTENSLFYIEKRECEICLSNKVIPQLATKNNLKIILHHRNAKNSDCLIYPLFFTMQMLGDNSETDPTKLSIDLDSLKKFREEFDACKSQFEKVKDKIKVCSNLFLEIKNEKPVITSYKHVLYFIYFVESIALQDCALSNEELKKFIIQTVISEKNSEILQKIRFWLLHREKSCFIYPQQLHKFTFQETDSRKIFGYLQKYLDYVYHKLCGEEENEPENQPFSILCHNEDLGNKLEKENISYSLDELSYQFIKEGFSIRKSKKPEKTLFNFIANFIPLLRLVYKKERETFKFLIDFRNQLIHNIYILYQSSKEVPYIAFQNLLYNVKEFLLKFNFCSKVTRELETISSTDGIWKSNQRIHECLREFKYLFSEELKSPTVKDSHEDDEKALYYLIGKIEQYFRSLFIIDTFNSITISNIKIGKFNLPLNYYRFSEENKKWMFKKFNVIKEINASADLSKDVRNDIEDIIKHELRSSGLSESEYKRVQKSVLNPENFDNEKLIKVISEHVKNIKNLKSISEFDMKIVINDYYMYLENDPGFSIEKYKKISLEQFTDEAFEVKFIGGSFYMFLSNILKNFIPLYFNMSPNYSSFKTVENIFKDQVVLNIMCSNNLDTKIIKRIGTLAFLAPLGVEILCNQKVRLGSDEERDFVVRLMQNLLESKCNDEFLNKLITLKTKEDCFESILKMDLFQRQPEKLDVLFSIPVFQNKLSNFLKSNSVTHEIIFIFIEFFMYLYEEANDLYKQQNYEEAFKLVNRKLVGLSPFLKEALEKKILLNGILVLKVKFLIAEITFQYGIQLRGKDGEGKEKHFENSLKMLEALLSKLSSPNFGKRAKIRWELRIKLTRARIYHFLGRCEESCDEYRYIFLKLYNICDMLNFEKLKELILDELGFINPKTNIQMANKIKSLIRTQRYKSVIRNNGKNLNIPQILRYYCGQLYCRMRQLSKQQDIFDQCERAILSCNYITGIQKHILDKESYMIKSTSFTSVKLYRLLKETCRYRINTNAKSLAKKRSYSKKTKKTSARNLRKPKRS